MWTGHPFSLSISGLLATPISYIHLIMLNHSYTSGLVAAVRVVCISLIKCPLQKVFIIYIPNKPFIDPLGLVDKGIVISEETYRIRIEMLYGIDQVIGQNHLALIRGNSSHNPGS